jgi:hypothetical protein
VDWALENLVPLKLLPQRPGWLFVSYEDLILHPERVIDRLAAELGLEDRESMVRQVERPSRSVKRTRSIERQPLIAAGNRNRLVDRWQEQVSQAELRDCFRILDRFGIDLYHADRSLPDHQAVGRRGFEEASG